MAHVDSQGQIMALDFREMLTKPFKVVPLRSEKATWKRKFKLPWREAGSPDHQDDTVDLDQ